MGNYLATSNNKASRQPKLLSLVGNNVFTILTVNTTRSINYFSNMSTIGSVFAE